MIPFATMIPFEAQMFETMQKVDLPLKTHLPTPVHPGKMQVWLEGYEESKKSYLLNGFCDGFDVGFKKSTKHDISISSKNLKSSYEHPDIVDAKIAQELDKGRIAGPFKNKPFDPFILSPIGVVPKKEIGKFRMIQHLSYPEGSSVNDGIDEVSKKVEYQSIDDAIAIICKAGHGCFLAKCDIASAFRIIPLCPEQYYLFGFEWRNEYYYDKCLPMGCGSSCNIFETLSTALHWVACTKLAIQFLVHFLDDFLLVHKEKSICQKQLALFTDMCSHIGVPIAPEKTVLPAQVISFLGYELDSIEMVLRLPLEKLTKCKQEILACLQKEKIQLKELQSIIGTLNFACGAVIPGRAFLRRLINLTIGIKHQYHHIRLTREAKNDLEVWLEFLEFFNGKSFLLSEFWTSSHQMFLFTDASKVGYGSFCSQQWFQGRWNKDWQLQPIEVLELYPICLSVEVWSEKMANRCIQFHTDNAALVPIINKKTSKNKVIMMLVRRLVLHCLKFNILFKAFHISGCKNEISDSLSRFQMDRFRSLAPFADLNPIKVPSLPVLP